MTSEKWQVISSRKAERNFIQCLSVCLSVCRLSKEKKKRTRLGKKAINFLKFRGKTEKFSRNSGGKHHWKSSRQTRTNCCSSILVSRFLFHGPVAQHSSMVIIIVVVLVFIVNVVVVVIVNVVVVVVIVINGKPLWFFVKVDSEGKVIGSG